MLHTKTKRWGILVILSILGVVFTILVKTGISGSPNEKGKIINYSLFIAYAPTKDPRVAISVMIPGGDSGTNHAALVASKILYNWDVLQKENKK